MVQCTSGDFYSRGSCCCKNLKSGSIMQTDDRFPTPPVFSLQTCPNKIKCALGCISIQLLIIIIMHRLWQYVCYTESLSSQCIEVTCWDLYLFDFPPQKVWMVACWSNLGEADCPLGEANNLDPCVGSNINSDYPHTIAFANLQWKLWKLEYSGSVLLPAERHGAPIWTKQRVANKKSSWQLWLNPPSSYPPPSCWFEYIQSKENVHERRVWASGTKLSRGGCCF